MQQERSVLEHKPVVISFQFSTFVSLMQLVYQDVLLGGVVISFQFSTFVSLMQPLVMLLMSSIGCD